MYVYVQIIRILGSPVGMLKPKIDKFNHHKILKNKNKNKNKTIQIRSM